MPVSPTKYIRWYISYGNFFGAYFPFVKPSVIFFCLDLATECGITDERDADGHFSSVI
jgi:hypothetical protein